MKETFAINGESYEDIKLRAILGVLAIEGIEVKDEAGEITVSMNGKKLATLHIRRDNHD